MDTTHRRGRRRKTEDEITAELVRRALHKTFESPEQTAARERRARMAGCQIVLKELTDSSSSVAGVFILQGNDASGVKFYVGAGNAGSRLRDPRPHSRQARMQNPRLVVLLASDSPASRRLHCERYLTAALKLGLPLVNREKVDVPGDLSEEISNLRKALEILSKVPA